jgi:hypothetical protein
MNNEPVAYLVKAPDGEYLKFEKSDHPVMADCTYIPLYTYPAKESKAKDRFSNYESICLKCGITIYKPAFVTLTDEEIEGIARANVDGHSSMEQLKWFARAILKRANEK